MVHEIGETDMSAVAKAKPVTKTTGAQEPRPRNATSSAASEIASCARSAASVPRPLGAMRSRG
jgi:hypothetical protein